MLVTADLPLLVLLHRGNESVPRPYGAQYPRGWTLRGYLRALKRGLKQTDEARVAGVYNPWTGKCDMYNDDPWAGLSAR
jgi:hypothetical protein